MEKPHPFVSVQHTPEQAAAKDKLNGLASDLLAAVEQHVPNGRYKSLAVTALETVAMWAIKGLTHS